MAPPASGRTAPPPHLRYPGGRLTHDLLRGLVRSNAYANPRSTTAAAAPGMEGAASAGEHIGAPPRPPRIRQRNILVRRHLLPEETGATVLSTPYCLIPRVRVASSRLLLRR
ncbi:hypothetical protein TRIUR3_11927 [Triticum urartu]|uniref:Uncharacterized protein n=1 Tax=Triticum urartu TaxID=4572 RepID=M7ZUY9_TRIUA|nr:hypothetical protein TRIUR3_11927 [Triticum urartu]